MQFLPSCYVFRVKNNVQKVRIVAKGFRVMHGVGYNEKYTPVVTSTAVRILLALVTQLDLEWDQMDFIEAFLTAISKKIYKC